MAKQIDRSPAAERMRRKIIACAHQLGWQKTVPNPDPFNGAETKKVADMKAINSFCKDKGSIKKNTLNDYTLEELPTMVTQFEQLVRKTTG
jgi:hypothetical protein